MIANLENTIRTLLTEALPGLFRGDAPLVTFNIAADLLTIDPAVTEATSGAPRTDDRTDLLPFEPASPSGPYTLTQPPYPGPRRVRLMTQSGRLMTLYTDEIAWDAADSRSFTLDLRPTRQVTQVQVEYAPSAAPETSRVDVFPFNPTDPAGPYMLPQQPIPIARHVALLTAAGEPLPLNEDEVSWDDHDIRVFRLSLRRDRVILNVQVLYGVTAVFTKVKATQTLELELQASNAAQADQAEAMVVAVLALNNQRIIDEAACSYADGEYGADVEITQLALAKGTAPSDSIRRLTLQAQFELKATRTLAEVEGQPMRHVLAADQTTASDRPVDIVIGVDV